MKRTLLATIFFLCCALSAFATEITVSSSQFFPGAYRYAGSTASLRINYSASFLSNTNVSIIGSAVGSTGFWKSVPCTIASNTLTCDSFTLESTVDSNKPSARFFAVLYDQSGARRETLMGDASGWIVPASPTTTTVAQLLNAQGTGIPTPTVSYLNSQQVQSLINTALGTLNDATDVVKGRTKISSVATVATSPVAVGQNVMPVNVKDAAYGAVCNGVTNDTAAFVLANTAAAAQGSVIYIPPSSSGCIIGTATITAPIRTDGGSLKLTTGQTTVFTNWIDAPPALLFRNATSGQGIVSFAGNTSLGNIYPQWWGAKGDDSTDSAAAFQAMLNVVAYNGSLSGAKFRIPTGIYRIGTGLTYRGDYGHTFEMVGESMGESAVGDGPTLKYTGSSGGTLMQMLGANWCTIRNIQFNGNGLALRDLELDYDSGRSQSSFDCHIDHCNFGGVVGVDSTCLVLGTSNFASAEHLITNSRFISYSTAGTSYYGIKNFGSANAKNYTIRDCEFASFRYGVQLGNSGYHQLDGVSWSGQTIADVRGSSENMRISSSASEGSAMFISGEASATVAGILTIEDSYWRGETGADDYVVEWAGTLSLLNNNFANSSGTGQVKIKLGFGGLGGSIFSAGNFYDSTGVTLASKPLFYDGSDRLIATLAAGSEGVGGTSHVVSINDKARSGTGNPVVAFPTWISDLNIYGATSVVNLATDDSPGAYSPKYSDQVMLLSASDMSRSVFLPAPTTLPSGTSYTVIRSDSSGNTAAVNGNGVNINGAASFNLAAQYDFVKVVSNGTQWFVEAKGSAAHSSTTVTGTTAVVVANTGKLTVAPKTNDTWGASVSLSVAISNHVIAASNTTSATSTITPTGTGSAGDWIFIDTVADGSGSVTVTFASTFHSSATQVTTASHLSSIAFKSDGTRWIEQYRTTNLP